MESQQELELTYQQSYYEANREKRLSESKAYSREHAERKRQYFRDWYAANRETELAKNKAKRLADPEKYREKRRLDYLKHREQRLATVKRYNARRPTYKRENRLAFEYGLTLLDFDRILAAQGGACAICGEVKPIGGRTGLHVDHDHATGTIRGILCQSCNMGLGKFHDNARALRTAADYLDSGGALVKSIMEAQPDA